MRAFSDDVGRSPRERRAIDTILRRATIDRAFRAALLDDPRRAIAEAYAVAIPPGFRLKFVERGPELDALVVLPDLDAARLHDDMSFDHVSGGTRPDDSWSASIID